MVSAYGEAVRGDDLHCCGVFLYKETSRCNPPSPHHTTLPFFLFWLTLASKPRTEHPLAKLPSCGCCLTERTLNLSNTKTNGTKEALHRLSLPHCLKQSKRSWYNENVLVNGKQNMTFPLLVFSSAVSVGACSPLSGLQGDMADGIDTIVVPKRKGHAPKSTSVRTFSLTN